MALGRPVDHRHRKAAVAQKIAHGFENIFLDAARAARVKTQDGCPCGPAGAPTPCEKRNSAPYGRSDWCRWTDVLPETGLGGGIATKRHGRKRARGEKGWEIQGWAGVQKNAKKQIHSPFLNAISGFFPLITLRQAATSVR